MTPLGAPGHVPQPGNPGGADVTRGPKHHSSFSPSVYDRIYELRVEVRENWGIAVLTENNELCGTMPAGYVNDLKSEISEALKSLQSPAASLGLMKLRSCLELPWVMESVMT